MVSFEGLLPWLLGGAVLAAGGTWLYNAGKLAEWFPSVFGSPRSPARSADAPTQARAEVEPTIELIRHGVPLSTAISMVLDDRNNILFSAQGQENRLRAMHYAERSGSDTRTIITGFVRGPSRFRITGIAVREMESGAAVTRSLRYSEDDGEELCIGANYMLALDAQENQENLQRLRGDPGLAQGWKVEPIIKQGAPGNPSSIVLNREGRVIYKTYTTDNADSLASRIEGQATIVTGEPDSVDPKLFRITRLAITERSGGSRDARSIKYPGDKQPVIPIGTNGIDFSSTEVIQKLDELREGITPKDANRTPVSDAFLGPGLQGAPSVPAAPPVRS